MTRICLLMLFMTVCGISFAHADSLRCGNKLVLVGDSMHDVKAKCGEPDDATHRTEIRTVTHEVSEPCENPQHHARCTRSVESSIDIAIDEWTYDFGPDRFVEKLKFENGTLVEIADGGYGTKAD